MPLAPTDPRMFSDSELPPPPTLDGSGMSMPVARVAAAPHYGQAGQENGNSRSSGQKPFERYNPTPGPSPYLLLDSTTNNGTISTYAAFVKPALDRQRSSDNIGDDVPAGQGTPSYPPAFLNQGQYYPSDLGGR